MAEPHRSGVPSALLLVFGLLAPIVLGVQMMLLAGRYADDWLGTGLIVTGGLTASLPLAFLVFERFNSRLQGAQAAPPPKERNL